MRQIEIQGVWKVGSRQDPCSMNRRFIPQNGGTAIPQERPNSSAWRLRSTSDASEGLRWLFRENYSELPISTQPVSTAPTLAVSPVLR